MPTLTEINVVTREQTTREMTPEEVAALNIPSAAQQKSAELLALAATYKTNLQGLQVNWLAASITGGATEATKKADVATDIADLKAQYLLDVAAIKAKYPA